MTQVWSYDENKIFIESCFVENVEKNMTEVPLIVGYIKPKWTGSEWIEGAIEEEIKEWEEKNKPKPKEPSETDLLQKQLLETQALVAELRYKTIVRENGGM